MFEVGNLVRSTRKSSSLYNMVMQIKDCYDNLSNIYPVNNGDIQTYRYFLIERGHTIDYQWVLPDGILEQVNEEDYYKDRYI